MDASVDSEVFEEAAVLDLGVGGIVADGPGLAAAGGSDNTGARADAAPAGGGRRGRGAPQEPLGGSVEAPGDRLGLFGSLVGVAWSLVETS